MNVVHLFNKKSLEARDWSADSTDEFSVEFAFISFDPGRFTSGLVFQKKPLSKGPV